MLLADLAAASTAVAATSSRSAKITVLSELLGRAPAEDVALVVRFMCGDLRQRRTGVGVAALREMPPPTLSPTLTVQQVDATFDAISRLSGPGSASVRGGQVRDLLLLATADEQHLLAGLISGELRQGAAAGVMAEAVALAGGVGVEDVRAAVTVSGSLADVATALRARGPVGLSRFGLRLGTPLAPMLAQSAPSVVEAFARLGESTPAGVEWKLDGIRVQLHRDGGDVAVFSRSGDDLTSRVPELVEQVAALPVHQAVLDAEAIVLRPDGRPERFQVTGSRVGRTVDVARAREQAPLRLFAFDALHLDGEDLLARPARQRWERLDAAVGAQARIPRLLTDDPAAAEAFVSDALARGHEGAVLKSATAPYAAGRRGAAWVKVKPRTVLDCAVLAAEWGHGRRQGWLSNLHLGAFDPAGSVGPPGGFVMLGKTFKGMTDAMLAWQTDRLLGLADGPTDGWVVRVRPEQVVEVAIDGVQASTRYPGGVALRFARVLRYRQDKSPDEADTISRVRGLLT